LDPGEAEVGELHASFAIDEDVTGGDIAMKHTVNLAFFKAVRVAQGRRNPLPDPHDLTPGEPGLSSKGAKVDPINELEDHVRALGIEPVIEDIDEVSVMKVPGDARFPCEELSISWFARAMRVKHLQTPTAFGAVIARPHHFKRVGRAATPDLTDDSILIDRRRDGARPIGHAALPLDVFFQSMSTQDLRTTA
jgi:hypothetical protein